MRIPSLADWQDLLCSDVDARTAYSHFFGKSLEEGVVLFRDNAGLYQEDLYYMPPVPFRYYLQAFTMYVCSEDAAGDSDAASAFLCLARFMLTEKSDIISAETKELFLTSSTFVSSRQDFYNADAEIYGDFKILQSQIEALLR